VNKFLTPYFQRQNSQSCDISVLSFQASDFAKGVAQDFNPIHGVGAKRFCVPGDLLFSLVLGEYGLSQQMSFNFVSMVGAGVQLKFPAFSNDINEFNLEDNNQKLYLKVKRQGNISTCDAQVESFIRSYVAFSGLNFTHVLVPMMAQYEVMINPTRPLVIYESMSFDLTSFDFTKVTLSLVDQELKVNGKRGDVTLKFEFHRDDGSVVGTGVKTLVMSGLRPYDSVLCEGMIADYESYRIAFEQSQH